MENALLVGLSRQMALMRHELDIIANNIANINTTGFKADNALFSEYLMPRAATADFSGSDKPGQLRPGPRQAGSIMSPGAIERTGNPLDVAIDGNGLSRGAERRNGPRYTRNGALHSTPPGQLVTATAIRCWAIAARSPFSNDHDVSSAPSGIITVRQGNSTADSPRGTLQLVSFDQPQPLRKDGARLHGAGGVTANPAPANRTWSRARSRNPTSMASSRWRA
jgi:flagellar basal-body rod protein FlgF